MPAQRISVRYFAARQPLIEDDADADSGAWQISWYRIAKGWGLLPETFWPEGAAPEPYDPSVPEPENLDNIAKRDRLSSYQRLRSGLELVCATTHRQGCVCALEVTSAWKDPPEGRIPADGGGLPVAAVHSISILGFDFEGLEFFFPNSWGREWGDSGFGYLPLEYVDRYVVEAWTAPVSGMAGAQEPGIHSRLSKNESPMGTIWVLDIMDGDRDEMVGWAHVRETEQSFDVEELFVRPSYRRSGYGLKLVEDIKRGVPGGKSLRFWVPWGDHSGSNVNALIAWCSRAGIELRPSGVRWAAFLGQEGTPVNELPDLEWAPSRATSALCMLVPETEGVGEFYPFIDDATDGDWTSAKSDRRAELVKKKYESSLSADEALEFARLQSEFGAYQDRMSPLP